MKRRKTKRIYMVLGRMPGAKRLRYFSFKSRTKVAAAYKAKRLYKMKVYATFLRKRTVR